jgi:crotonobetainyl-CoA:carnitine CoA-transferase CaiB-like acyl-CoA transferase
VALAALEPHLWERFCRALNREDWRGSPTCPENPLYREVQQTLMTRSAADWEAWAKAQSLLLRALRPYRPPEHIRTLAPRLGGALGGILLHGHLRIHES